jgi:hypothetical protein
LSRDLHSLHLILLVGSVDEDALYQLWDLIERNRKEIGQFIHWIVREGDDVTLLLLLHLIWISPGSDNVAVSDNTIAGQQISFEHCERKKLILDIVGLGNLSWIKPHKGPIGDVFLGQTPMAFIADLSERNGFFNVSARVGL